ncbi:MAG: 4-hydroxythreonine-4-phosphate dehydrogenase PdxA [Candidatus Eisenbacteria bacterium]|uniref:4-hydroxythreonine-4-phosphate dehydrogenase PdxA n=1 Tax=Eiseniibacteriota bacterium TaxID=2212470 RepID=A0A538TD62_UNCEI|nr:MAG: 4-hydroxythreonine-4-phosphate dehydrogenase PdxA [Candidatus Eisenbacteria bacterium]TMQ55829.1 MAG: 4-hydroxythreonine-4-phosphate dehydrogenase PdxA [Candidatus Eisenbacteria bacterium]TMQ61583.1 MAG: 4-hydroxythreonine-4-phosphate dehydrogenase PdxA [Candidatus Eisenbacteria bacterium]
MAARRHTLLFTMGDPAGIGPEILVRTLALQTLRREARLVAVGDPEVIDRAARHARVPLRFRPIAPDQFDPKADVASGIPLVMSTAGVWGSFDPGVPSEVTGRTAARAIEVAAGLALDRRASGIVTAPISKKALHLAGYPFPGHTEFLGSLSGASGTRMLFAGGRFRIVLATVHVALRSVPDELRTESLSSTIEYAAAALRNFRWGSKKTVAVLALNPHAGEGGLFGDEEERVIGPAMERARANGIRAEGPFPADTFFGHRAMADGFGVIVAMYHDQGLIAAKMDGIGGSANVTLGLPFIRSSVDHGTAFDRAWKRGSRSPDPSGLVKAARVAIDLTTRTGGRRLEWSWP